MASQMYHQN